MQEQYNTPSMMTEASWRQLGQAARWAHANADVLLDTHWVGGIPAKLEPYGYASWSPRKGTLTPRCRRRHLSEGDNVEDAPHHMAGPLFWEGDSWCVLGQNGLQMVFEREMG